MIPSPLRRLAASLLPPRAEAGGAAEGAAGDWHVAPGGTGAPGPFDWVWRPAPWCRPMSPAVLAKAPDGTSLTPGVRLFHDCPTARVTLAQGVASGGTDATHDVHLDAPGFAGTFLSLALDLPAGAARGLRRSHVVGVSTRIRMADPTGVFVRLNIRHGPNTERKVEAVRPGPSVDAATTVEFDLGFDAINPARRGAAWIDLIFEAPSGAPIRIGDLTVSRRPRADL